MFTASTSAAYQNQLKNIRDTADAAFQSISGGLSSLGSNMNVNVSAVERILKSLNGRDRLGATQDRIADNLKFLQEQQNLFNQSITDMASRHAAQIAALNAQLANAGTNTTQATSIKAQINSANTAFNNTSAPILNVLTGMNRGVSALNQKSAAMVALSTKQGMMQLAGVNLQSSMTATMFGLLKSVGAFRTMLAGIGALVLKGIQTAADVYLGYREAGFSGGQSVSAMGKFVDDGKANLDRGIVVSPMQMQRNRAALANEQLTVNNSSDRVANVSQLVMNGMDESGAAKMATVMDRLNGYNQEVTKGQINTLQEWERLNGIPMGAGLKEAARQTELFSKYAGKGAVNLSQAAVRARQMGIELSRIDSISDEFVGDFEGMLTKTAAIQTYLPGADLSGFSFASAFLSPVEEMAELQKFMQNSVGGVEGFDALPKMTRKALEQQLGMTSEELRNAALGISPEQAAKDKKAEEDKKTAAEQNMQTSMLDAIAKNSMALIANTAALIANTAALITNGFGSILKGGFNLGKAGLSGVSNIVRGGGGMSGILGRASQAAGAVAQGGGRFSNLAQALLGRPQLAGLSKGMGYGAGNLAVAGLRGGLAVGTSAYAGYNQFNNSREQGKSKTRSAVEGVGVGGAMFAGGLQGASLGAALGPIGAVVGGAIGAGIGGLIAKGIIMGGDKVMPVSPNSVSDAKKKADDLAAQKQAADKKKADEAAAKKAKESAAALDTLTAASAKAAAANAAYKPPTSTGPGFFSRAGTYIADKATSAYEGTVDLGKKAGEFISGVFGGNKSSIPTKAPSPAPMDATKSATPTITPKFVPPQPLGPQTKIPAPSGMTYVPPVSSRGPVKPELRGGLVRMDSVDPSKVFGGGQAVKPSEFSLIPASGVTKVLDMVKSKIGSVSDAKEKIGGFLGRLVGKQATGILQTKAGQQASGVLAQVVSGRGQTGGIVASTKDTLLQRGTSAVSNVFGGRVSGILDTLQANGGVSGVLRNAGSSLAQKAGKFLGGKAGGLLGKVTGNLGGGLAKKAGGFIAGKIGGAMGAAKLGATLGSIIPGAGTLLGGGIGFLASKLGGGKLISGAKNLIGNVLGKTKVGTVAKAAVSKTINSVKSIGSKIGSGVKSFFGFGKKKSAAPVQSAQTANPATMLSDTVSQKSNAPTSPTTVPAPILDTKSLEAKLDMLITAMKSMNITVDLDGKKVGDGIILANSRG